MEFRCSAKNTTLLALTLLALSAASARAAEAKTQEKPSVDPVSQQALPAEVRGDVLMAHQQYVAAIQAYQKAPHDSAMVWNKLGVAYHHLHSLDQAKTDYQQALRLDPKCWQALNNLGVVYYSEKDYKRAEKLYRRALKIVPKAAVIYNNLGTAYFAHKKMEQGTEAYRSAFAIDPMIFAKDPVQNVQEFASTEERARLDFCLAELFAEAGMKDQAIEYLHKALDAGFSDSKRLVHDPEFASIRQTAEFAQVLAAAKRP